MSTAKRKLNLSKLAARKTRIISTEEALRDIVPISWSENVISGRKKITVTKAK